MAIFLKMLMGGNLGVDWEAILVLENYKFTGEQSFNLGHIFFFF